MFFRSGVFVVLEFHKCGSKKKRAFSDSYLSNRAYGYDLCLRSVSAG